MPSLHHLNLMLSTPETVKFSEHVATTTKALDDRRSMATGELSVGLPQRVVRIILTDADATDSSDDDRQTARRVKRHVEQINLKHSPESFKRDWKKKRSMKNTLLPKSDEHRRKKYRGVRQRPWGRKRVWLGTYDSAEEAATVYDRAAVRLKGLDAVTNIPRVSSTEGAAEKQTESDSQLNFGSSSPMSVLRYEDLISFDGFAYGDFEDDLPEISVSFNYFGEDFSEFDPDDFLLEDS